MIIRNIARGKPPTVCLSPSYLCDICRFSANAKRKSTKSHFAFEKSLHFASTTKKLSYGCLEWTVSAVRKWSVLEFPIRRIVVVDYEGRATHRNRGPLRCHA